MERIAQNRGHALIQKGKTHRKNKKMEENKGKDRAKENYKQAKIHRITGTYLGAPLGPLPGAPFEHRNGRKCERQADPPGYITRIQTMVIRRLPTTSMLS